jgi:hypothetical protein
VRWLDLLGFAAAAAVLAGFCMNTIINLRLAALASNFLFILYGLFAHIYPVIILHIILLPVNLLKLHRIKSEAYSAALSRTKVGTRRGYRLAEIYPTPAPGLPGTAVDIMKS